MKLLDCCLDLLYPPRCVFCDALLQEGEVYFCRNCGEKVPMAEGRKRVRTGVYFDRCVAPLLYQDMVRESFLDYKFHKKILKKLFRLKKFGYKLKYNKKNIKKIKCLK